MRGLAPDRFRYFRVEARELLDALGRGILDLEKSPADRAIVAGVLRHAHTLKGAARVVQQHAIGELAHALEGALAAHREASSPPVPRDTVDALLRLLDEIEAAVARMDRGGAPDAPTEEATPEDPIASARPEQGDLDGLREAVLEAGVQAAGLRAQLGKLERAARIARVLSEQLQAPRADGLPSSPVLTRVRSLSEDLRRTLDAAERAFALGVDQAAREIANVRDATDRLRLVDVRTHSAPLERVVRDAARALDRSVSFELEGGDVRLDASVLAQLRGALQHVLRNAVTHGIEAAAERERAGKAASGRVHLRVERRGPRVAFTCRDDGRGVDVDAVRAAAVRKGLLTPPEASRLAHDEVLALLLRGGLSTAQVVTEVSGRGVGLDVVRDTAARLGGEVRLRSEPGRATTVEIELPAMAASISVLTLEAGGAIVCVPLAAVEDAVYVRTERVVRTGRGAAVEHRGAVVPFMPLAPALGLGLAATTRRSWSAVVVRAGQARVALGADRLLGTADVVVHPLPRFVQAEATVLGASLDAEGHPRLVLDPAGLATARGPVPVQDSAPAARLPILVIDDSLTTRILEQSILESAGYAVELAISAEEALERCREQRFALFLVDIEMPGMDGLEFVRLTRADPRLRDVPAILVSSRSSAADRRRGAEVGAAHYIAKDEFDQGQLLAAIRRWVG